MKFAHSRSMLYAIIAVLIPVLMLYPAGSASAAVLQQSDVILEDDFSNNANNWNIGTNDNVTSTIENGKLNVQIQRPSDGSNYFQTYYPSVSAEDVDISVDAVFTKGAAENTAYGFNCRFKDKENKISLVVKPSGTFTIQKMLKGNWTILTPWSYSGSINRKIGETNNLRLVCTKGHIILFINNNLAADVMDTDKSLAGGSFRLSVGAYGSNNDDKNAVEVSFDNLVLRKLKAWKAPIGVLFAENFDKANDNWKLTTPKTDWGYSDQISDGQLVMNFEKPDAWSYKLTPIQLSNVDLSFDITLKQGDASYGAMCRVSNNDNYYAFDLSFDADGIGYYFLGKNVNANFVTLIDWTASKAVKAGIGITNRVRVVCSGSDLALYVNGQPLFKKKDTSLAFGGPAMSATVFEDSAMPVSVAFDNLEIKYP